MPGEFEEQDRGVFQQWLNSTHKAKLTQIRELLDEVAQIRESELRAARRSQLAKKCRQVKSPKRPSAGKKKTASSVQAAGPEQMSFF